MNIWSAVIIAVSLAGGLLFWLIWGFAHYKRQEKNFKKDIYGYLESGLTFEESLKKSFSEVNRKYNLGLNEYTNSRILMIDEHLSNLNQELCNDVLMFIKGVAANKNKLIIIVSHQAIEGFFDDGVITV